MVEAADHLQVLEPGQALVDGGVLAGEPDLRAQLGGVADDVEPGDAWRCPPLGGSSVVRIRTAVVLPAPFGPEQPEHGPGLDREVDPAQRLDVAVGLAQALDLDRRRRCQPTKLAPAHGVRCDR